MEMPLKKLTRAEIVTALQRLSELAQAEGVRLEVTLYGGAVMLLAYDARDVTRDVDAIVHPPAVGRRLVARVGADFGWPENWLNDEVKLYLSTKEAKNELVVAGVSAVGLHITRPTAKYLLAMKVMACRKPLPGYAGDFGDIELLLRVTRCRSVAAVEKLVDSFFPDTVLPDATKVTLGEMLERIRDEPS